MTATDESRAIRQLQHAISPICGREGCEELAVYQPVLQFRVHQRHTPAEVMLGIGVCPACRETCGAVDDWLTTETFERVAAVIKADGKTRPKRALTTLRWIELPAGQA